MIKEHSICFIKNDYFEDFPDPYLKKNKDDKRPHYYCFQDNKTGLYWVIPLSSQIEKYRKIMDMKKKNNKPCDILHITKLGNGKLSVFLIQDIFPVTEKYIDRQYTINGIPLMLNDEKDRKEIRKKVTKIMGLMRNGIKLMDTQPDILSIEKKLLNRI